MQLSSEKVPNLPLNGQEVLRWIVWLAEQELARRPLVSPEQAKAALLSLQNGVDHDSVFLAGQAWPNLKIELTFKFDQVGPKFAVQVGLKLETRLLPPMREYSVFCRPPLDTTVLPSPPRTPPQYIPEPPLSDPEGEHRVDAFMLESRATNPNLIRVHMGLPIRIGRQSPPEPGQLFGKFEYHNVEYSREDNPPLDPPVISELGEHCRIVWNLRKVTTAPPPGLLVQPEKMLAFVTEHHETIAKASGFDPEERRPTKAPAKNTKGRFVKKSVPEVEPVCRG